MENSSVPGGSGVVWSPGPSPNFCFAAIFNSSSGRWPRSPNRSSMGGSSDLRGPAVSMGASIGGSASAVMDASSSGAGAAAVETESRFGVVGGSTWTSSTRGALPCRAQKASNTSWHLPQRTWPWAALSCAEVTRNLVLQLVQTVNISVRFPCCHYPQPIVPLRGLKRLEMRRIGPAQFLLLTAEDTGEHQPAAGLEAAGEERRQVHERPRQDVGQQQVRMVVRQRLGRRGADQLGHAVALRVVAGGRQGLGIVVHRQHVLRPQAGGGDGEDAGAAAVVDDRRAGERGPVQPFEAERRGGVGAGAEGQAGIQQQVHGLGVRRGEARGADPEALAEAHGLEVL